MCPLWPAHYLFMYILVLGPLWLISFRAVGVAAQAVSTWDVTFEPESIKQLKVGETVVVTLTFNKTELLDGNEDGLIEFEFEDNSIAHIFPEKTSLQLSESEGNITHFFNVTGDFLGYTKIWATYADKNNNTLKSSTALNVDVIRLAGAIDKAFTYSVAGLVAIIYINMGAALDTRTVIQTIKRPIGPAIGFFAQFVIMPLLAFGLAKLFIPNPAMQLGLFITGCSPGGGASNIWTLTLGGNLDLSITMTTISTFCAFAMMPLWIFTLGSTIFQDANLTVPYSKIVTFAVGLVVPLIVGIIIQRTLPKVAKFLVRILRPFAVFLILFIIVFAVYTNIYLFKLFTWPILMTGMLLPWLGYLLGGGTAWLLKQEWRDILAIGVETGVQNTGLAIFALRFSLEQPAADLTTALPVAVAIMTPVIPALIILVQKITGKRLVGVNEEKKDPLFVHVDEVSQQRDNKSYGSI